MIEVKGLEKRFGSAVAVGGISFEVHPGEVVGFLGPNGAGKTTTLRMLAGYLAPSSGRAVVAGCDVAREGLEARRRIGYLPENNPLYEDLDAAEYLEWCACVRGLKGAKALERVRYAVSACGLGEVLSKPIGLLSKGYRQRLGLAAAILHDPEVLLLDEPTSGLDPNQSREVRDLIARLKESKTVLLSTHILPEVESSCDRVVILHRGRIAASGTPKDLAVSVQSRAQLVLTLKDTGLDPDKVREEARRLVGAGACEAHEERGEIRLRLTPAPGAGDLREDLFKLSVDQGWVLLELRREEASLEAVFRELTPG